MGNVHKYARAEDRPEKTLFVITTDGMENASRRYTYGKVRAMIEHQKEKYGWEFLFLGANIDAAREAARFGIGADRAANYHADQVGTGIIYEAVSKTICNFRSSRPLGADWKAKIDEDYKKRGKNMYGAILGDIIGSPYEFDRGRKTKKFPLFIHGSIYTDDTVMTIAVAEAFLDAPDDEAVIKQRLIGSMQRYGKLFPQAGYGGMFYHWLKSAAPQPYGSCGNGSAMRVSSAAWLYNDLETVRHMARLSAEVTHNHPEGIKGAEATASAIFLARTGSTKAAIKAYIEKEFHYDLSRSCDEIRPSYRHVETCQETVPEAITAFLEGESFEDVIRTAVSLGGDCDTLTCIAGSIAEGFYGVPEELKAECLRRLPEHLRKVLLRFEGYLCV